MTDSPPPRRPATRRARASSVRKPAPDAEAAASASPPRSRRRLLLAAAGVVGTAVVGALAAAIITPGRLDQLFAGVQGTPSPTSAAYKRVTDATNALALEVPDGWIVVDTSYDLGLGDGRESGVSLLTGSGVGDGSDWGEPAVFVGASRATSERYGLVSADGDERLRALQSIADAADWTIDGCLPTTETLPVPTGFTGISTSWDECVQTPGMRLWETYSVSDDGSVFLITQVFLPPDADAAVAERALRSLAVTLSEVPPTT